MSDLLNVDEALNQILQHFALVTPEEIDLADSLGRILAEDLHASINLPPFANSSMDGYAVQAADLSAASQDKPVRLRIVADIPAGSSLGTSIQPGEAARIMTGAPLPDGADAVVPVEATNSSWLAGENIMLSETVAVYRSVEPGAYIRPAGEDVHIGQQVLQAGTSLSPQALGILAALGYAKVAVRRQPRVVIVSTGDELVDISEPLSPGKIRDVNGYTIAGLVRSYGGVPLRLPIAKDSIEAVQALFQHALDVQPDLIISSAGVSVGTFDVVRSVLNSLGEIHFWRVNIRPGKPLAFGKIKGIPFFGLPGNPVSAMVTFDIFVRPALLRLLGRSATTHSIQVRVGEALRSDGRRSYLRVTLQDEDGQLTAYQTGTQSSGALMSMVLADALLIVPEDVTEVAAGSYLEARLLRDYF